MFENTEEKLWHWFGLFFIAFPTENECEIEIENTILLLFTIVFLCYLENSKEGKGRILPEKWDNLT